MSVARASNGLGQRRAEQYGMQRPDPRDIEPRLALL